MTEMSLEEDSVSGDDIVSPDTALRFLLVEDSDTDAFLVQVHLKEGFAEPASIEHVTTAARVLEWLNRERFDLVQPGATGPDVAGQLGTVDLSVHFRTCER